MNSNDKGRGAESERDREWENEVLALLGGEEDWELLGDNTRK